MPTILIVRHGENDYVKKGRLAGRLPGVHLNEKGRQQAQQVADSLAEKLKEAPIRGVFASPLERTIETAQPIALALGLQVIPTPGLIETNCGEWQDQSVKKLSRLKIWRAVQNTPSLFCFPGGESFAESQFRIVQEIQFLCSKHDPKDIILCVSHADPIRLLVAYYLGLPLDLFQRLVVNPASVTALHIGDGSPRLLSLNSELSFSPHKK